MEQYIEYLRKSRMDTDYDEISVEETLNRHRTILADFCKQKKINVTLILEEVVSGESLTSRPEMVKLLDLVNTGSYAGVVCMDIDRLSRGSSLDSGYIMQILQTNNCKIITPSKTYDLANESDEQFTDMKFMFSRYELKTITKRLVRGRNQSASEGKFMGSIPPYGYRIVKLQGTKGNSLEIIPEEAEVVKMIFDMYGNQGIGYNTIAYKLNQMHIPSQTGSWGQSSITNILSNEVYLGMIRWKKEPVKRQMVDGKLVKKRYNNTDYELHEGLHDPIITQEMWDKVKDLQATRFHPSVNTTKELQNPFATILFCEKCGAVLKRNVPAKYQNTSPWYRCPTRGCNCKAIKVDLLEDTIVSEMTEWLKNYTITIDCNSTSPDKDLQSALKLIQDQLSGLQDQQEKICALLEQGVYTVELFSKRNSALEKDIKECKKNETDLLNRIKDLKKKEETKHEIIPKTQHLLDSYDLLSASEKNLLWCELLEKVTAYRSPETNEINIQIYPRIPR